MNEFSTRLAYLFYRYYSGEATADETAELMSLARAAKNDPEMAALLEEFWEKSDHNESFFSKEESDKIFNSIVRSDAIVDQDIDPPVLNTFYWWRYAAAAIIVLFGFGTFYKFQSKSTKPSVANVKPPVTDFAPGGNRALLTLADGSTIVLDSAANGVLAKQGSTEVRKKENGQLVYNASNPDNVQPLNQMNMLSTPKGGQYEIVLPDGSKVWLNSSSSIKFPAIFSKNERKVEVTGEVYFEVVKDKTRPFKVSFLENEIEVLGTSFNVMAYTDEVSSKTTLVEGSVSLKNNRSQTRLNPGQQASVETSGKISRKEVDVDEAIAWKKGQFYFRDASIEEVMKKAARWYDIDIEYQGKIPVRQFTGKVSMDVNISELLHMLKYAGVNCKIENKKIIISS
ncbi:FecR domain-containing protein [Dyadobacter sp. CY345]|uniref:FecR family protein n=1 Tax=Dyadobacter sp. CY345 TaxID=2909335 RepID=UPI001F48CA0E|nr:FecR family protein [Dyadobacter sp. CY345]MCF2446972.1 FecR domain-containing protein [Dyadobacter sp. CY345]